MLNSLNTGQPTITIIRVVRFHLKTKVLGGVAQNIHKPHSKIGTNYVGLPIICKLELVHIDTLSN